MSIFDPHEDLYALLEVPPDASDELIRQRYRDLVQQHLWDRQKFERLNRAFEVLSNPALRAEYDKQAAIARPRPDLSTLAAPASTVPPTDVAPTIIGATASDVMATQQIANTQRTQMGIRVTCPVCRTESSAIEGYCEECGFALEGAEAVQELPPIDLPALPTLQDLQGNTYTLRPGVNTVGRVNADVLLTDPSVSRSHARIVAENGTVTVEDVGSTNGTFVNGQKLAPNTPMPLADGAEVTFGGLKLTLRMPTLSATGHEPADAVQATSAPETPSLTLTAEEQSTPIDVAAEKEVVAYWCSGDGTMRVPLALGTYTIGRRPTNHIVIADPYVSGSHAILVVESGAITIEDVGSTNGTFVDDTKLIAHVAAPLSFGVKVQIGQNTFHVEGVTQSAAPEEETSGSEGTLSEAGEEDAEQP